MEHSDDFLIMSMLFSNVLWNVKLSEISYIIKQLK